MAKKLHPFDWMTIGQVAKRTGLAASAIRFYEEPGLVHPTRDRAGQRRFRRADLRRLSFVMAMQILGFSLARIREEMAKLPEARTPNARDWSNISKGLGAELDRRIALMVSLRESLEGCIGCGCLSMDKCALFNPEDRAAELGEGPRYLMGDSAADIGIGEDDAKP